ncbi:hypothetical protein SNTW_07370 [Helicobacter suis]|uniref:Uncharacterized protein n=1 Tax=Helicobacter suis TaxID=104628 RepID=A0A6J4CZC0_9HELI|nr:hypothetical protein SNTW_07370 [Helicobacter suis]
MPNISLRKVLKHELIPELVVKVQAFTFLELSVLIPFISSSAFFLAFSNWLCEITEDLIKELLRKPEMSLLRTL